jgi:hypothetical protein
MQEDKFSGSNGNVHELLEVARDFYIPVDRRLIQMRVISSNHTKVKIEVCFLLRECNYFSLSLLAVPSQTFYDKCNQRAEAVHCRQN